MADVYKAQLLVVEARLAKEPDNEELLTMKSYLIEAIELKEEEEQEEAKAKVELSNSKSHKSYHNKPADNTSYQSKKGDNEQTIEPSGDNLVDKNDDEHVKAGPGSSRRQLSEAELAAKKKEKNRKKKEKSREKSKEQFDAAEKDQQSWQSFANQKGLKGLTKKSIFASPCSVTGKVGVGTNGIADAPGSGARMGGASSSSASTSSAPITKRRRY